MYIVDYYRKANGSIEWALIQGNNVLHDWQPFDNGNNSNFETLTKEEFINDLGLMDNPQYFKSEEYNEKLELIRTFVKNKGEYLEHNKESCPECNNANKYILGAN